MSKQRLITMALLLSVAINLLLVGGIVSRLAIIDRAPDMRPVPNSIGWLLQDLSDERRRELLPLFRDSSDEVRPLRREMMQAQRRIARLMAADTLDHETLSGAFATLREVSDRYQRHSHEMTVDLLAALSPEERQQARAFLQRRGPRESSRPSNRPRPNDR